MNKVVNKKEPVKVFGADLGFKTNKEYFKYLTKIGVPSLAELLEMITPDEND